MTALVLLSPSPWTPSSLVTAKTEDLAEDISVRKPARATGALMVNAVYNRILKLQGCETPFRLLTVVYALKSSA